MNLPNKLTVLRLCMVPIFLLFLCLPLLFLLITLQEFYFRLNLLILFPLCCFIFNYEYKFKSLAVSLYFFSNNLIFNPSEILFSFIISE